MMTSVKIKSVLVIGYWGSCRNLILIRGKFKLKLDRCLKKSWQEYGVVERS